jgi:predicted porin
MITKKLLPVVAACTLAAPAYAVQITENFSIDGWVLMETWNDRHELRSGIDGETNEPDVFLLHMVNFSGGGELEDDYGWSWKLGHRNRNGNMGGTGSTGARDAWLGVDGNFGEVKFGRILTRSFEVLDWPYGSDAWIAEATAETGANMTIYSRAIRYTAPEVATGVTLELTYDVGQSYAADADARAYELFARWNLGRVRFDLIHQLHDESPTTKGNGADGVFGADGAPTPTKGNEQSMTFLGMRVPFGSGFEGVLAYKRNQWKSSTPGFFDAFEWTGQAPLPNSTEVENARVHAGLNYRSGKWMFAGAVQQVLEGEGNVDGKLDDETTIFGFRAIRDIGKGAQAYAGIRHHKFNGNYTPVDSKPWHVQGAGNLSDSNTRIGFGLQMFY